MAVYVLPDAYMNDSHKYKQLVKQYKQLAQQC